MATNQTNNKAKPSDKPLRVPPEERFWKRYSPHFEFPLSLCSSTFLHAITLVGIAVLPFLLGLIFKPDNSAVPISPIVIAGGGGNPEGIGKGPGDGVLPTGNEKVKPEDIKEPVSQSPRTDLDLKKAEAARLDDKVKENQKNRKIEPKSNPVSRQLTNLGNKARKELEGRIAGRGQGGTGSEGGKGSGTGPGEGPLSGPGKLTQRERRQGRWVMIFNTRDGNDYAEQLRGLGAILALQPDPKGPFLVIRDLRERPAHPREEDLSKIDRIYWVDDKTESVRSLALALGLDPVPPKFVAFFPASVEKELLEKELAEAKGIDEDDIEVTYFRVQRTGNGYEVVVSNQKRKERR